MPVKPKEPFYLRSRLEDFREYMTMKSTIELKGLALSPSLGTYGPGDVVPEAHLLDMTLTIDPKQVLIDRDGMEHVFDYDLLILEIDRLAKDGHYHTQERLMTRIVYACAAYSGIKAVELTLSKKPVLHDSGQLGVCLGVDAAALDALRAARKASAQDLA